MFYIKFTPPAGKCYFDSLQWAKLDIAHLDVLSMIHDLLHFFHERNQPNFTLVVVKFYNGLRNVHYRERFNHVSACVPQLRFLYLSCLLWFDSSVLYSVEFTVQCRCLQIPLSCSIQKHQQNFHLETELDAINLWMFAPFIQRSQMFFSEVCM